MNLLRIGVPVILISALASAQSASKPFRDFLPEQARLWTSPARIAKRQAPWIALAGAGTVALIAVDARLSNGLPNSAGQLRWSGRVSNLGGAPAVSAFAGGLIVAGTLSKNQHFKGTGLVAAEALAHAFVMNYGIKAAFGRERPGTGSGRGRFGQAYDKTATADTAFPSGHAMTSWAVASVISSRHPNNRFVPWLVYGYAAAVSASRVPARKHFVSDVVAGSAGGYLIGKYIAKRHWGPGHGRGQGDGQGHPHGAAKNPPQGSAWMPRIMPLIVPSEKKAGIALGWGSGY